MEGQRIPNMTHPDVPIGSEDVASLRKEVLISSPLFDFLWPYSLDYLRSMHD